MGLLYCKRANSISQPARRVPAVLESAVYAVMDMREGGRTGPVYVVMDVREGGRTGLLLWLASLTPTALGQPCIQTHIRKHDASVASIALELSS